MRALNTELKKYIVRKRAEGGKCAAGPKNPNLSKNFDNGLMGGD